MAAKIRKGDKVAVIAGKDKGKRGEVVRVIPSEDRAVVQGLNVVTRHTRQSMQTQGGLINGGPLAGIAFDVKGQPVPFNQGTRFTNLSGGATLNSVGGTPNPEAQQAYPALTSNPYHNDSLFTFASYKLTDSIKKQLDKQLQAAKDKVSKIADTISSLKDTIKQTASSVAQNYLPDFTTNALFGPDGKMIKGTAVSSFKDQISGKGSVIAQVTAAYKKLVSEGLNKDFLATLLQSGNNNLILDLGQSSKSDALSAQSMYQNVTAQATALGNAVANNTTAKAQLDTATKHLAVAQRQEQAAQRRENALNSISHKLDKLDKLKKLDTLDTDITRGLNRLISAANNGRRS